MHAKLSGFVALCLVTGLVGCNRDRTAELVAAVNTSNVQRLANLYAAHQNHKNGRGPASESEFREFVRTFDPNKLKMMGINPDELDQVFTSEADGKPLRVRYNVGGGRGSRDPVVFEQDGKDGLKRVGYTGGTVEEVDDATAQQLWAGKGASGPPGDGRPTGRPIGAPVAP
jgi:hypothetical protein